jgi:hypothetical protein
MIMTRAVFFHEVSENVQKIHIRTIKEDGTAKLGKKTIIDSRIHCTPKGDVVSNEVSSGNDKYVRMFTKKTFLGAFIPSIPYLFSGWETLPCYRTSYKAAGILRWEDDCRMQITPDLLKNLSEDDTIKEIASVKSNMPIWFLLIGVVLGAFLCYWIMTSGVIEAIQSAMAEAAQQGAVAPVEGEVV